MPIRQSSAEVRDSLQRQGFRDEDPAHVEAWIRNRCVDPVEVASLRRADLDREVTMAVRICRAVPRAESEAMADRYGLVAQVCDQPELTSGK